MKKLFFTLVATVLVGAAQAAPSFRYQFFTNSITCGDLPNATAACSPSVELVARSYVEASTMVLTLDALVQDRATYHLLRRALDNVYEYANDGFAALTGAWLCQPFFCRIDAGISNISAFLSGRLDVSTVTDGLLMSGSGANWTGSLRTDAIYIEPTIYFTGYWRLTQVVPEPHAMASLLLVCGALICIRRKAPMRASARTTGLVRTGEQQ